MEEIVRGRAVKELTPIKAIRAKCLECCCDQVVEVRLCPSDDCPLWEYRMGHRPARSRRILTDEQKARMAEQLNRARMENF